MQSQVFDSIEVLPGPPDATPTRPTMVYSPAPSHHSDNSDDLDYSDGSPAALPSVQHPSQRSSGRANKGKAPEKFQGGTAKIARIRNLDDEDELKTYWEAVNHPTQGMQWKKEIGVEMSKLNSRISWTMKHGSWCRVRQIERSSNAFGSSSIRGTNLVRSFSSKHG